MTNKGDGVQPKDACGWFAAAVRWYEQGHQACPCCRGRHCVFRARWGSRTEYHCNECDFSAAHDDQAGAFVAALGREPGGVPLVLEGLGLGW